MKNKQHGFTLLELLITVAIIAIISAIAWPSYQNYVIKGRRTAATACMMEASQYMERFYTMNLRYDQTRTGTAVSLPNMECRNNLENFYTFSLANVTETGYSVRAVPQGQQATKDTECATLTLTATGQRTSSGGGSLQKCWG